MLKTFPAPTPAQVAAFHGDNAADKLQAIREYRDVQVVLHNGTIVSPTLQAAYNALTFAKDFPGFPMAVEEGNYRVVGAVGKAGDA